LIAGWVQWNWEAGEQGFKTALELNPSDAMSHIYYAHLLVCLNRNEEALVHGEKAVELDPLNPLILSLYAAVLSTSDQLDYALVNLEKALSIDPYNFFAHHILEFVSYDVGDREQFMRAIRFIFPLEEETFQSIERTAANDGLQSAYEELVANLEILSKSTFLVPVHFANRYVRIHQNEKALDQLELGLQVHDQNMPYITCRFLRMEPLFGNPRFQALVDTLKLPMPEEY
jgi:tetratricopeptide (TPR) repeat protein